MTPPSQKRSDEVFVFHYRDGTFELVPVVSKKSEESGILKNFIGRLRKFGLVKSWTSADKLGD
jgi:hypothetical protein